MSEQITTVGVVGCGTMGSGISEVCARAGYTVVFREIDDDAVEAGLARIRHSMDRAVEKGKLAPRRRDAALGRISGSTTLEGLKEATSIVEAVPEKLELKQELFKDLDAMLPEHAILATNTSSLPVIEMAVQTGRPEPRRRVPLLQPGAGDGAGRAGEDRRHRPRGARHGEGVRRGAREEPGRLSGPRGLHREPVALPVPEQRRADGRVGVRDARGHRRGDAVRVRASDGAARAARPDRARLDVRDPRRDVPPVPRDALRAVAAHQATRRPPGSSAARPDAASTSTRRPTRRGSRSPATTAARCRRRPARTSGRSASSARGRWRTGSPRSPRRPATRSCSARARSSARASRRPRSRSRSAKAVERGKMTQEQLDATQGAARDDDRDGRVRRLRPDHRGDRRGARRQARPLQASSTRSRPAHAILASTTSSLPVVALAAATERPEQVVGMHFFNPRR